MILSGQSIRKRCLHNKMVEPFAERSNYNGLSYGLSMNGYDVRVDQKIVIAPGEFKLASTLERFNMPLDLMAIVHDKSTLARQGSPCRTPSSKRAGTDHPFYLSRVLRLMLLAPEIIEAILDGRQRPELQLDRLLTPFPVEWDLQRETFGLIT